MEKDEDKLFILDRELLIEYPEISGMSGLPEKDVPGETYNVSQIYVNGRTIDSYITDVKSGKSTGSIEYLLKMVEDGLTQLETLNKTEYRKFIDGEKRKFDQRKEVAKKAIGQKIRDGNSGYYIYR
jgi:hypothetical protein